MNRRNEVQWKWNLPTSLALHAESQTKWNIEKKNYILSSFTSLFLSNCEMVGFKWYIYNELYQVPYPLDDSLIFLSYILFALFSLFLNKSTHENAKSLYPFTVFVLKIFIIGDKKIQFKVNKIYQFIALIDILMGWPKLVNLLKVIEAG